MADRIKLLGRLAALGLAACILLSRPLWATQRFYPLAPLWGEPWQFSSSIDSLLFFLLLGLTLLAALRPGRVVVGLLFFLITSFCLLDQSRLQPWLIVFSGVIASTLFPFRDQSESVKEVSLKAVLLLLALLYFWSGAHKFNLRFISSVSPWILSPWVEPHNVAPSILLALGLLAPFLEVFCAVALLSKVLRRWAILILCAMHLMLLSALGPWGHAVNSVIWPWNIAMLAILLLLLKYDRELPKFNLNWLSHPKTFLVLVFFGLAPGLNLISRWDSYASFSLYSGITEKAFIQIENEALSNWPKQIVQVANLDSDAEQTLLSLNNWSFAELNVPSYPSLRVYRKIFRQLCQRYGAQGISLELESYLRRKIEPQTIIETCAELER